MRVRARQTTFALKKGAVGRVMSQAPVGDEIY